MGKPHRRALMADTLPPGEANVPRLNPSQTSWYSI